MTTPDHLLGDLSVLRLVQQRARARTRPGQRDDPHRLSLVIEGGGMRGVYVGGMVRAIGELGWRLAFDDVLAVSAGALTGGGLVTGRTTRSDAVYYDGLANRSFIDLRRVARGNGPLVDLDFMFDHGMEGFDLEEMLDTELPLRPVATALDDLSGHVLCGMRTAQDWRLALHASACIPLWAGPPVTWAGRQWVDGFVTDPLPVGRAIDDGASHVLVLMSRSATERSSPSSRVSPLLRRRLERLSPGLATAMSGRSGHHAAAVDLIAGRARRGGAHVLGVRPTSSHRIRALTIDPVRLRAGGAAGQAAIHDAARRIG